MSGALRAALQFWTGVEEEGDVREEGDGGGDDDCKPEQQHQHEHRPAEESEAVGFLKSAAAATSSNSRERGPLFSAHFNPRAQQQGSQFYYPPHKVVPGTDFVVDGFTYQSRRVLVAPATPGSPPPRPVFPRHFFLSHWHADHYVGLTGQFGASTQPSSGSENNNGTHNNPLQFARIFASPITCRLAALRLGKNTPAAKRLVPLRLNRVHRVAGVEVTLIDANHCPGAVLFLFRVPLRELGATSGRDQSANRYQHDDGTTMMLPPLQSAFTYECSPAEEAALAAEAEAEALRQLGAQQRLSFPTTVSPDGAVTLGGGDVEGGTHAEIGGQVPDAGDAFDRRRRDAMPQGHYVVLHTGDFRFSPVMKEHPALRGIAIDALYLDDTYMDPSHMFPEQRAAVDAVVRAVEDCEAAVRAKTRKRTLYLVGTYQIGKEKILTGIMEQLGLSVFVTRDKFRALECCELTGKNYGSQGKRVAFTTKAEAARVHCVAMNLSEDTLREHLKSHSGYAHIVAFRPTGWTFAGFGGKNRKGPPLPARAATAAAEVKMTKRTFSDGTFTVFGVPYSEHSSFAELVDCVRWFRPARIVPTVNVSPAKAANTVAVLTGDDPFGEGKRQRSTLERFLVPSATTDNRGSGEPGDVSGGVPEIEKDGVQRGDDRLGANSNTPLVRSASAPSSTPIRRQPRETFAADTSRQLRVDALFRAPAVSHERPQHDAGSASQEPAFKRARTAPATVPGDASQLQIGSYLRSTAVQQQQGQRSTTVPHQQGQSSSRPIILE